VKRLNGWDAMLLYSETPNVYKHTLKIDVADFDGKFTFDFFRTEFRRRLHRLEPSRLKPVDTPKSNLMAKMVTSLTAGCRQLLFTPRGREGPVQPVRCYVQRVHLLERYASIAGRRILLG
jgi:hypothetical protein